MANMRELRDIPNQEGFKFTGVYKDSSLNPCIVHKDSEGMHCAYNLITNLKCYDKLQGWLSR